MPEALVVIEAWLLADTLAAPFPETEAGAWSFVPTIGTPGSADATVAI